MARTVLKIQRVGHLSCTLLTPRNNISL